MLDRDCRGACGSIFIVSNKFLVSRSRYLQCYWYVLVAGILLLYSDIRAAARALTIARLMQPLPPSRLLLSVWAPSTAMTRERAFLATSRNSYWCGAAVDICRAGYDDIAVVDTRQRWSGSSSYVVAGVSRGGCSGTSNGGAGWRGVSRGVWMKANKKNKRKRQERLEGDSTGGTVTSCIQYRYNELSDRHQYVLVY